MSNEHELVSEFVYYTKPNDGKQQVANMAVYGVIIRIIFFFVFVCYLIENLSISSFIDFERTNHHAINKLCADSLFAFIFYIDSLQIWILG